jgi:hypothetical protein
MFANFFDINKARFRESTPTAMPLILNYTIVIFTLTLAQKFEISNLKLSLINSLSFIQSITYTKRLNKKKI